ncbi:MAG: hypothetical protein IPG45_02210 [Deltaproteobacteria bacterium]|nr:hypothetical protein [Deltaproteobacteria bacterium]
MQRRWWLFLGLWAWWGCDAEPIPQSPPSEVEVMLGAPMDGTFALSADVDVGAGIEAVGLSAGGTVVLATAQGVYEVRGETLERRAYFKDDGDPEDLGTITVIGPRPDGGTLLGSSRGLFLLDSLYVTKSPLDLEGAGVNDLHEQVEGPLAGLWLATDRGLYRRSAAGLVRLNLEGMPQVIKSVAIEQGGAFALVIAGGELHVLEPAEGGLRSDHPPLDTGTVRALAGGDGVVWAATERGLFRYDPKGAPAFRHYPLASSEAGALAVLDVAVDSTGATWALVQDRLFLVETDRAIAYPAPGATQAMVDRLGDVWAAAGERLLKRGTSTGDQAVTFTNDVKPWVTQYCAGCHRNQTQDFLDYQVMKGLAEKSLLRVRSGDMPRCQGSLRCEPAQRLGPSQYSVLEQWIRHGLPE